MDLAVPRSVSPDPVPAPSGRDTASLSHSQLSIGWNLLNHDVLALYNISKQSELWVADLIVWEDALDESQRHGVSWPGTPAAPNEAGFARRIACSQLCPSHPFIIAEFSFLASLPP